MSVTYQKITGNMTYQSTVKVVNPDQVYKILQERKDAGDERILLGFGDLNTEYLIFGCAFI